MFNPLAARRAKKGTPISLQSHTQKKYFSLMLVPSYSTGKTRSIRIPYGIFYFIIISLLVVGSVTLGFYLRSNHFMRVAKDYSQYLDQAQEAFVELKENSDSEQSRLMNNSQQLEEQLSEAQAHYQVEKNLQKQAYQESLNSLQEQVNALEQQLRDLEETRQEILSNLGAKAYIPPVNTLLQGVDQAQTVQLSTLNGVQIRSDERTDTPQTTPQDLEEYFALLTAKIEAQFNCFADLSALMKKVSPYVKNYPTRWPVYGSITSAFGYRKNPMGGSGSESHEGLDIRCSTGTSVRATGGGTVIEAGWHGSYGYLVVIDHGFGIHTAYGHNSKLLVSVGQAVARGDVIARSGSTGRSTGPHVHYEVRVNGVQTDPQKYFLE